jgi:predicted nucleic acid-binding protein
MIVVADTSPINYLIRCGYIWILPDLFGEVLVPNEVATELMHPSAPEEVRAFAEAPPHWFRRMAASEQQHDFPLSLGPGERAAISLALSLRADVLLIDDLAGRKEAQRRGVRASGTFAVLLQASIRGHVSFPEAFAQLTKLGFRVSKATERAAFNAYRTSREA